MTRLIDADALQDKMHDECCGECESCKKYIWNGERSLCGLIEEAPTVPLPDFKEGYKQAIRDGKTNFSRPKGKWIECNGFCECSECQHREDNDRFIWNDMNFCSTCGAEMVEVTQNE
jgi:hypothetical protein